jgi:hypothetical protein
VLFSVTLALTLTVAGCASSSIIDLPIEQGDIAAGRQAFIAHRCHQCHTIADEQLPALAGMSWPMLQLGGPTTVVRSYEDLMTSIINPDHAISERYSNQLRLEAEVPLESPMRSPDLDTMTVSQLIDIVVFLDSKYEVLVPDYE